ncbi:hypothetical protein GCM10010994_52300 [Chelatococcus reniformis]|uniref:Uncharacterized protein n=1 Tax=Chelatococcus reniformis TaxID=1494448 RepID=A0A916UU05_9HYPH|nr:hypothetical protein GCM10010994_52300 [Chelatococcus reniformis]
MTTSSPAAGSAPKDQLPGSAQLLLPAAPVQMIVAIMPISSSQAVWNIIAHREIHGGDTDRPATPRHGGKPEGFSQRPKQGETKTNYRAQRIRLRPRERRKNEPLARRRPKEKPRPRARTGPRQ